MEKLENLGNKIGLTDCKWSSLNAPDSEILSLTVCAGNLDAVGCWEEPSSLLLAGEAVWDVAVELEGGRVEGGVEGVLAAGVAPVQRVAHEAADPVGHCNIE